MALLTTKFITDNAVIDTKIRLQNAGWLRSRNAANSADINVLSVDSSDAIQFGSTPQFGSPVVNNNDATNKTYVDTAVSNLSDKNRTEFFTLSSGDISNGYIDLSNPAFFNSVYVDAGGVGQIVGLDYSLSTPTANTRVTFLTPLTSILAAGDEVTVNYTIATSLGSQQPSGKYTLSALSSLTQVTGADPTDFGQYRAMYRLSSALTDASGIVTPTLADGFLLYGNVGGSTNGTASQPTVYRIFVGKNKATQQSFWNAAARVANVNVDFVIVGGNTYGLHQKYDPVSGILEINGDENGSAARYSDWAGSPSLYFDSVISDNPVNIGTVGLFTGMIVPMGAEVVPFGMLECDGSAVSRIQYSRLFSITGTRWGIGDGSTTFNVPDLRGQFLRGWDHAAGNDPDSASRTNPNGGATGDNVGSYEADAFQAHTHYLQLSNQGGGNPAGCFAENAPSPAYPIQPGTPTGNYSSETRPKNADVMYCIVY